MKIFRKFRFKSVGGSGFKKYLLYAIGEIVLVVAGILIALALNDVKDDAKRQENTKRVGRMIVQELKKDIADINEVLVYWDDLEATVDTILYITKPDEPLPASCINCQNVLNETDLPNISNRVIELVEQNELSKGVLRDELTEIATYYKEVIKISNLYERILFENLTENLKVWKDDHAWFSTYIRNGICLTKDCEAYFQNSTDFRNRVAYFNYMALENYYGVLVVSREEFKKQIKSLEILLGD